MGGWKVSQSKIKKRKKIRLAVVVLGIIAATLIVGNSVKFFNGLFKPLDDSLSARQTNWDGNSNLYLVVKNRENISLLTYDPSEKKVVLLNIPPETYINVPGGFGSWQVRSVFDLGNEDKQGAVLLKNSISDFFALPIYGFLETQSPSIDAITALKNNPVSVLTGNRNLRSDLTIFELLRLYFGLHDVRSDKITEIDLLELDVLETSSLADGTKIFMANSRLDSYIQEYLYDAKFKSEQLSIAVLNGTSYPGLAQKAARMISNMGGNVIISDNTDPMPHSFVVGEDSFTKNKLEEIFGSKYAKIETQTASRAQIVIFLGEDFKP